MQKQTTYPQLNTIQMAALVVGLVGLVALGIGAALDMEHFVQSYLFGYLFALAPALGCLGWMMIHHLTGGGWGITARRILEAGAMTLPLMALLFVPIALNVAGMLGHSIYHWSDPALWADPAAETYDPIIAFKTPYLNVPFFVGRAVFYFLVWAGIAWLLRSWSLEQDRTGNPNLVRRMRVLSGIGIPLFVLTVTFMALDWGQSLDPHWFSTMYGVTFIVGEGLFAMALTIIVVSILIQYEPMAGLVTSKQVHDMGKLLFAFTVLWAYVNFGQYLIIWNGNIAEFTPWYVRRATPGWLALSLLLILFHFFVPFFVLLSRRYKKAPATLALVAGFMILMRFLDMSWVILPEFRQNLSNILWTDIAAPIGFFGIWLAAFIWMLKRSPVLPMNDPNMEKLTLGGGHH